MGEWGAFGSGAAGTGINVSCIILGTAKARCLVAIKHCTRRYWIWCPSDEDHVPNAASSARSLGI